MPPDVPPPGTEEAGGGIAPASRRADSRLAARRTAYISPPSRPITVDSAMPNTPQWKTKVQIVVSITLMTLDQIPAHIVERVSWWAFTIESGRIDQNEESAEPATRTDV